MSNIELVVWSGGLDSTYLLYKEFFCKAKDSAYPLKISTCYFDFSFSGINKPKIDKELKARKRLIDIFKFKGLLIKDNIVDIGTICTHEIGQVGVWFSALLKIAPIYRNIYMGYVQGDEFWYLHNDFVKIYSDFCNMFSNYSIRRSGLVDGRFNSNLCFPLKKTSKDEIIRSLLSTEIGRLIYSTVWFCEGQEDVQCVDSDKELNDFCTPCSNHLPNLFKAVGHLNILQEFFKKDYEDSAIFNLIRFRLQKYSTSVNNKINELF